MEGQKQAQMRYLVSGPFQQHHSPLVQIKLNTKKLPADFFVKSRKGHSKDTIGTPKMPRSCLTERRLLSQVLNPQEGKTILPQAKITSFFKMAQISSIETDAATTPDKELRETFNKEKELQCSNENGFSTSYELKNTKEDDKLGYTFSKKALRSFRVGKTISIKGKEPLPTCSSPLKSKQNTIAILSSKQKLKKSTIAVFRLKKINLHCEDPTPKVWSEPSEISTANPNRRKIIQDLFLPRISRRH